MHTHAIYAAKEKKKHVVVGAEDTDVCVYYFTAVLATLNLNEDEIYTER